MAMICRSGSSECTGCMRCYDDFDEMYDDYDDEYMERESCRICFRGEDEAGEIYDGLCEECANEVIEEDEDDVAYAERK